MNRSFLKKHHSKKPFFILLFFTLFFTLFLTTSCTNKEAKEKIHNKENTQKNNKIEKIKKENTMKTLFQRYVDGNGNSYLLQGEKLHYQPLAKHQTSTGYTDNGPSQQASLSSTDLESLNKQSQAIYKNKNIHIKQRLMGSGMLFITLNDENIKILISNAKEKQTLERELKKMLNKNKKNEE